MNRCTFSAIAASLLALAASSCRSSSTEGSEQPDMATETSDMAMSTGDPDMTTPPPVDLAGVDLAGLDLTAIPPPAAPAELLVLRVGDGTTTLSSAAAPAFLERYKVTDGSMVGTALALPTAVSGSNHRLTIGGSTNSEGALSRSDDGHYVVVGGYDADVATAAVAATKSSATGRVIGRLDKDGNFDTTTVGDFFSAANIRSVSSKDGSGFWAVSNTQLLYMAFGPVTQTATILSLNGRYTHVVDGQLYASSGSGANRGVNTVGTGAPMTAATAALLPGFASQTGTSPYGFVGFDLDGQPGFEILYVADDSTTAVSGVQRWTRSGTSWTYEGTLNKTLTAGARGLAGYRTQTGFVLFAATADTPSRLVKFIDDYTAKDKLKDVDPTVIATAADKTAYRGVALAPM